jgi:predicted transcriptional regulator
MKDELLNYCYEYEKEFVYETSQREFDCLIRLVENETISTFEQLAEYGMEYFD